MDVPRKRGRPKIIRPDPETPDRKQLQRDSKHRPKTYSNVQPEEEEDESAAKRRRTRSHVENSHKETEKTPEDSSKKKRLHTGKKKSVHTPIVMEDEATSKKPATPKVPVEPLQLECCTEEITPEQLEYYVKVEKEYKEVLEKFEALSKENDGETVHTSDSCIAYQYIETLPDPTPPPVPPLAKTAPSTSSGVVLQSKSVPSSNSTYQLVMDPRIGMIVGTISAAAPAAVTTVNTLPTPVLTTMAPQARPPVKKVGRGRPPSSSTNVPIKPVPITPQPNQASTSAAVPTVSPQVAMRPTESTATGGLAVGSKQSKPTPVQTTVVDLTADDGRPPADSREVAFNKLQGKTFPSLVVVARPHLRAKDGGLSNDRSGLDVKVKSVLIHTATKFTEWLIQQGLIRSEQMCSVHPNNKLNLGMYSDVSKFPYSGGYVWISECCPSRFVSVFSGSLFEGALHAPSVLLKLIYHWACQTNIQNVVQWVKVDNLYVKGLFTWLRATCTFALQQHLKPLGGPGKKVEVGVISLGTTSQDGAQRQVKVEVLGVLDPESRMVRLRAVEPLIDRESNYKRRFSKILEPLRQWVHPDSIIATDLTVDKVTLLNMGFSHVVQQVNNRGPCNKSVMEYLRKIVPRMFQNTLSLLSRQIIQQFLDELVWRESFGETPTKAFNSIVLHLGEQTRLQAPDTLIHRLNKVAANPFKNHWQTYQATLQTPSPVPAKTDIVLKRYARKRATPSVQSPIEPEKPNKRPSLALRINHPLNRLSSEIYENNKPSQDAMVPLENYYYGTMQGDMSQPLAQIVTLNLKCCVCKVPYQNNVELLDHLLAHAHNLSAKMANSQCKYCLAILPSIEELNTHIGDMHPVETTTADKPTVSCIICEMQCANSAQLGKHLSNVHVPQEMPYLCGTCGYRSSSHRNIIDHFYTSHNGATTLQCPFCLKSMAVWSSAGRVMSTSVTFFFNHLQKHQKKSAARKCPKCSLWFCQREILKEHLAKAHVSMTGKKGVKSWQLPINYYLVPKSKLVRELAPPPPERSAPSPTPTTNNKLTISLPSNVKCRECFTTVRNIEHFPQRFRCNSCQYNTDCIHAIQLHKGRCRKLSTSPAPRLKLDIVLHCICGYSSDDGNQVAKHLALCERRTAYPTAEQAKAATVPHSMLDVLGLMRRSDDNPPAVVADEEKSPAKEVEVADEMDEDLSNLEPTIENNCADVTTIDD